jgi:transcriptional regulator with XRE-family HTH domain
MIGAMAEDASRPHARLGAVVRRRREKLGMSVPVAAQAAKIDRETWRNLEAGKRMPRGYNRTRIERTLGWAHGGIEAILDGGEPALLPQEAETEAGPDDGYLDPVTGELYAEDWERELWDLNHIAMDERRKLIYFTRADRARTQAEQRRAAG